MPIADRQRPPPGAQFLDHVAHFVPDLDKAGALLEALGFAVTPVSVHSTQHGPAGSSNRCLMLREGYVEILAPTADTPNARRLRKWMRRYRGVHLVCFGTPAAGEDHFRLTSHGFAVLSGEAKGPCEAIRHAPHPLEPDDGSLTRYARCCLHHVTSGLSRLIDRFARIVPSICHCSFLLKVSPSPEQQSCCRSRDNPTWC